MRSTFFIALLLATCASQATCAQTASGLEGPSASTDAATAVVREGEGLDGLEDIVVTATRREERLQDVPVAVTALTAASLESSGVSDVRSLTQLVPGFFGGKNIGLFLPTIRAVGTTTVSAADEANVATYIDGIYQPDPYSTFIDLGEVERVEVLRGPQGTIFGRNATGGLINVITPDPEFSSRGRIAARVGRLRNNANDVDLRGYLTGGLSDTVAANLSTVYRNTDDYMDDLARGGEIGGNRILNLRGKLLVQPSDTSQIILTGEYTDQNGTTNALQPFNNNNTAGRQFAGVVLPTGPWQSSTDFQPRLDFSRYNLALRTRFELGAANLETSTGYMHNKTVQVTDSDSSNIRLGAISADAPNVTSESISQEIRLLSANPGRLQWILGAYAFRLDADAGVVIVSRPAGPTGAETVTRFQPDLATTSYAGFGEATYEVVDSLFFTVGLRYTWEKRELTQYLNGNDLFGRSSKSFDKFTYRTALRYNFTDRANIYASYGTGYKSGVFNFVGTTPDPVDPESITAYEVGLKVDPLPWLRTNLSVYYYDYDDLQVVARAPVGNSFILQNAATAEIYGGELEITAAATDDLNLRGSLAYTHGNYKDFPLAQTFVPGPTGGNSPVTADVSGNNMIRAPRLSFNIGFDWGADLAGGRLGINANLYHSSRVYFDFANRFSQKPYELVSSEISWTTADEAWRFSLWTNNLTNAKVYREIRAGALGTDVSYEQPRRVGIGASYKF